MEKMALVGNLEEISDDSASVCDSLSEEGEIRSIEDEVITSLKLSIKNS